MKQVKVVAAVLSVGKEFLCVQRGINKLDYISKKWEFPGGKIEAGETEAFALQREIREELRCEIIVGEKLITVDHKYPDFRLIMEAYRCTSVQDGYPAITLTEHLEYKWLPVHSQEFLELEWAAADLPIVEALRSLS